MFATIVDSPYDHPFHKTGGGTPTQILHSDLRQKIDSDTVTSLQATDKNLSSIYLTARLPTPYAVPSLENGGRGAKKRTLQIADKL